MLIALHGITPYRYRYNQVLTYEFQSITVRMTVKEQWLCMTDAAECTNTLKALHDIRDTIRVTMLTTVTVTVTVLTMSVSIFSSITLYYVFLLCQYCILK